MHSQPLLPPEPPERMLFIRFYHGRNTPDETMNEWGFEGPIVGPCCLMWTYGNMRIGTPSLDEDDGVVDIEPRFDNLIEIDGKFYGDFETLCDTEEYVRAAFPGQHVISVKELYQIMNQDHEGSIAEVAVQ